jgi:mannose-6-phosphate isomerase-like protein (cupin superfamily)
MHIINASAEADYAMDGVRFTALASPSRGTVKTCMWRIHMQAGNAGMPHQVDREELIHALAGEAIATIDGRELKVSAGETLVVVPGQSFSLHNAGPGQFDAIAVAPVGIVASTAHGDFAPPWTI